MTKLLANRWTLGLVAAGFVVLFAAGTDAMAGTRVVYVSSGRTVCNADVVYYPTPTYVAPTVVYYPSASYVYVRPVYRPVYVRHYRPIYHRWGHTGFSFGIRF